MISFMCENILVLLFTNPSHFIWDELSNLSDSLSLQLEWKND